MENAIKIVRAIQIAMLLSVALFVLAGEMVGSIPRLSNPTLFYALSLATITIVGGRGRKKSGSAAAASTPERKEKAEPKQSKQPQRRELHGETDQILPAPPVAVRRRAALASGPVAEAPQIRQRRIFRIRRPGAGEINRQRRRLLSRCSNRAR